MYYLTESNGGREIAPLSPYLRQIVNAISKEVIKEYLNDVLDELKEIIDKYSI